jgi:hypothetical protein
MIAGPAPSSTSRSSDSTDAQLVDELRHRHREHGGPLPSESVQEKLFQVQSHVRIASAATPGRLRQGDLKNAPQREQPSIWAATHVVDSTKKFSASRRNR